MCPCLSRPAHAEASASGVDTYMKTFHEWLAMRREGLWLGDDKLAVPGMSDVNPLHKHKKKHQPKTVGALPMAAAKPRKAVGVSAATPKASGTAF